MSDDTPDRLVYWACGLLIVPVFAADADLVLLSDLDLGVKVILLEDDSRVVHLWKWNPNYDDHASCVIWKIETFTKTPTTYAHQDRPFLFAFIDGRVILINRHLVVYIVPGLFQDLLVFVDVYDTATIDPPVVGIIEHFVGRKEDQDPTRHLLRHQANRQRQIVNHRWIIARLVIKLELLAILALLQDVYVDLVLVDDVWIFKFLLKL